MRLIKNGLSSPWGSVAVSALLRLLELGDRRQRNLLWVLTYHRVDWPDARPDLSPGLIGATPPDFAAQMELVAKRYQAVSLNQVIEACRDEGAPLPPRSVLITFDDAYEDFQEHAWPVLRQHGLPVVLFVPTSFPDQPDRAFWWDRLYAAVWGESGVDVLKTRFGRFELGEMRQRTTAYRELRQIVKSLPHAEAMSLVDAICGELNAPPANNPVLGWDALRRLAAEGVALAPHTQTHPMLNRISLDVARREAVGSLADLRREIGTAPPVFAYPAGGCDDDIAAMLREEGFQLAFTTRRGVNHLPTIDRCQLRRINVGRATTLPLLRAQLLPQIRYCNGAFPSG